MPSMRRPSPSRFLASGDRLSLFMPQLAFSRRPTGIHSLPIELLTIIFLLGADSDNPYADGPFLLKPEQVYKPVPSSNFQVLVSHVCQHWRQVALSIPALWTTLHFRDPTHLHRATTYLARCSTSRTYLLDVLVDTVAVEDHVPGLTLFKDELSKVFQIIMPHLDRWRAFHLKIADNECKVTARMCLGNCGGAPNLETLQLYHFENFRTSQSLHFATYRPPVVVFNNSLPRLKNISLIGVNLPWDNSPYLTRLHQLELALHREIVRPPYNWWDHYLRSSPDLKVLCLHYSGPKEASPNDPARTWYPPEKQIPLEKLSELSLTDLDPGSLCEVMKRLSLPGLKKLSLDLPEQDYTPFIELITSPPPPSPSSTINGSSQDEIIATPSPLIPSITKVESLVIHSLECTLASWIGFLRAAQNLRELKVNFDRVGEGFWDVFTQDENTLTLGLETQSLGTTGESNSHSGRNGYGVSAKATTLLLPRLETFQFTGVSGECIISALRYRHHQKREFTPQRQEWVVVWSERRSNEDALLNELIERGYWAPEDNEHVREEDKVIIRESYDEEDEDNEEDDEDDDDLEAVDSDEESEE